MDKTVTHYNNIAHLYDNMYSAPEHRKADDALIAILKPLLNPQDRVLDLGCGTGFFLDHVAWSSERYLGVDPSSGMCLQFRRKHPGHTVVESYLTENIIASFTPTLILGLYAVGDHLTSEDIDIVGRFDYFMMFSHGKILNSENPLYRRAARLAAREKHQGRLGGRRMVFGDGYSIVSNRL